MGDNQINDPKQYTSKYQEMLSDVEAMESFKFLQNIELLNDLQKRQISLRALQIQVQQELIKTAQNPSNDALILTEEELNEEISKHRNDTDQLNRILLKYQSYVKAFQDAVFRVQVESCVDKAALYPETREKIKPILEHNKSNLEVSIKLAKEIAKTEELDKAVLSSRMKFYERMNALERKWKQVRGLENLDLQLSLSTNTEPVKKLEEKIRRRKVYMDVLANMIQNIICISGENWAKNNSLLETMKRANLVDKVMNELTDERELNDKSEIVELLRSFLKEKSQTSLEMFLTSTPKIVPK